MKARNIAILAALGVVLVVAAATRAEDKAAPAGEPATYSRDLRADTHVMGTWATLTVVAGKSQADFAARTLDEVEAVLRGIEARMSARLETAELVKANTAPVGQVTPLSANALEVLREARSFTPFTNGAFDVTCRPILEMWRLAAQAKKAPTDEQIRQAVENTGWRWFELTDKGIIRKREGSSIDLGGIAKKYGIDQSTEVLLRRGVIGGMVNVGGDIRCVGRRAAADPGTLASAIPSATTQRVGWRLWPSKAARSAPAATTSGSS